MKERRGAGGELGVLIREPEGGPGAYRFSTQLHYLYFAMEAGIEGPVG